MQALNLKIHKENPVYYGQESTIARARELKRLIESHTAELAALKESLVADATARRVAGESSVYYATDGKQARVTWSRKYRDVPVSEASKLGGALEVFQEKVKLSFKPGADTTALAQSMLDAGLDPREWFSVASVLEFIGDADDPYYAEIVSQIQVAPGVFL